MKSWVMRELEKTVDEAGKAPERVVVSVGVVRPLLDPGRDLWGLPQPRIPFGEFGALTASTRALMSQLAQATSPGAWIPDTIHRVRTAPSLSFWETIRRMIGL